MNGILKTYENNSMSLSCKGEAEISDGIIKQINFKGLPRKYGDNWIYFYKDRNIGDTVTREDISSILSYNGWSNVVSVFEEVDTNADQ